ncbi:MAG TPA: FAD-binding protein [Cellulomonas sp.]
MTAGAAGTAGAAAAVVVLAGAGDDGAGGVGAHELDAVRVAGTLGLVIVVLVGADPAPHAARLGAAGAVLIESVQAGPVPVEEVRDGGVPTGGLPPWWSDVAGAALADAAVRHAASWVLAAATPETDEAAALAALRLDADLVVGAVSVHDGPVVTTRPAAGRWSVGTRPSGRPAVVTLLVGGAGPAPAPETAAEPAPVAVPVVLRTAAALPDRWAGVRVGSDQALDAAARPSLARATVVVGAGRGAIGHLDLVERLADLLAGAVGATRAVVDAGGVAGHLLVGQSGQQIAPRVYVAVGVSGALQHLAGVAASTTVVAVDVDPHAPVFGAASYGVVGDAGAVLRQAVDLLSAGR